MKRSSLLLFAALVATLFVRCGEPLPEPTITPEPPVEDTFYITANPDSLHFDHNGGKAVVQISANCEWVLEIPANAKSWISATPKTAGGDRKISLIIKPNTKAIKRMASVRLISGDLVTKINVVMEAKPVYTYDVPEFPGKQFYIPNEFKNQDWTKSSSRYCYGRMAMNENFVMVWEEGFGEDPTTASANMRFDPEVELEHLNTYYNYYKETLNFLGDGQSKSDDYLMLAMVSYTTEWTAFGSGYDDMIGTMWLCPAVFDYPYAIAHELGHCFQYQTSCDGAFGFRDNSADVSHVGTFWEQCAQWMAWQVMPDGFETYYFTDFINLCHQNFSSPIETFEYSSFMLQELWHDKYGPELLGRVWRESVRPEHPLQAYMRIQGMDQAAFNDEVYEYAARNITWDYEKGDQLREVTRWPSSYRFPNRLTETTSTGARTTKLEYAPRNYGFNATRLDLPDAGATVTASFQGLPETKWESNSGWRFGFVCVSEEGEPHYGDMGRASTLTSTEATVSITIPDNPSELWFVVVGAPNTHDNSGSRNWTIEDDAEVAKYPYAVSFVTE